jgi:cytochrome c-type biogenesis protein CcmF
MLSKENMMFGNVALALAIAAGVTALPAYVLWARGNAAMRGPARLFTIIMAAAVLAASAFQMRNILAHQFQYEYVTNFSDRSLPPLLLAATCCCGRPGASSLPSF